MSQKFNFTGMVKDNPYLSMYFDDSGESKEKSASQNNNSTFYQKPEHQSNDSGTQNNTQKNRYKHDQEFEKIVNNSSKTSSSEQSSNHSSNYQNPESQKKFNTESGLGSSGGNNAENKFDSSSSKSDPDSCSGEPSSLSEFVENNDGEQASKYSAANYFDYHGFDNEYDSIEQDSFEPKTFSKKRNSKIFYKMLASMILTMALVSGGFLIYQSNRQTKIGGQVLGTVETKTTDVITGGNFALVINQRRPKEFILDSGSVSIDLMDGKPGNTTSYLYKRNGMQSGIVVVSAEYDSKMDINSFAESVKNKLGGDYQVTSKDISLPNGVKLAKINSSTQRNQAYYVTVTTSYYYIITMYNQIGDANTTSFMDKMIQGLYLNSK